LLAVNFNVEILRYLNRLSDVCWLLARYAEHLHDEAQSSEGKR
jgi:cob(I)alamin adenosyltransferase